MKQHQISTNFSIPENDVKVIQDIIACYSGSKIRDAKRMLLKVFASDIRTEHYMCLGFLIGESVATENQRNLINQNFLCLKQN